MTFDEHLEQLLTLLQREGRITYRALKRRLDVDEDYLADLTAELVDAKRVARDEDGRVLVWTGASPAPSSESPVPSPPLSPAVSSPPPPVGERRQLTVMFCDLVGSTALSAQLDPEDYQALVQRYHHTCETIVAKYDGRVAQHLGDGLLVYFGYPTAHEDDARRAVKAGLEILTAMQHVLLPPLLGATTAFPSPLGGEGQGEGGKSLPIRIGVHTGLVVVSELGSREKRELLALGETPNLAARIQGLADPSTLFLSAATYRLIPTQFECQPRGSHLLKGLDTPIAVYHVRGERHGLPASFHHATPLVGREQEVGMLRERWEQVKDGRGQVILLTGEAGIGKSRLTQTLTEQVTTEGALALEARCSPYHQNSAFHPLAETLPLFAALLSLPLLESTALQNITPQKQKERTLHAMVQWWLTQAERQSTVSVWEDLHWADPSTLEFLTILLEQIPTCRLLVLLTARPEFVSPWLPRSHMATVTLNRLGRQQTEAMITKVPGAETLSSELRQQILIKTDGVPLFVEELTKSVLETVGTHGLAPLQALAIPATLQDSLMARLDRLNTAKELAQLGSMFGREFSYELLHVLSPLPEDALQLGLRQLVDSELVYQRGLPPKAQYTFKHALIQDTAYQSLLKSRRQQLHRQIAQILEERFPDTKANQPEILAHHYTEAHLLEQAIPYWQQAGQQATQRSANQEAINYLTRGLETLQQLPDTPARIQQELQLQVALSPPLMALKGWATPELDRINIRAQELCQQIGDVPQLFPVWWGLASFSLARADYKGAFSFTEKCLHFAQHTNDSALLLESHWLLGHILSFRGNFVLARKYLEKSISLYNTEQHSSHASLYGQDPGIASLTRLGHVLWYLGYPDKALKRNREGVSLAQESPHSFTRSIALGGRAWLHDSRREEEKAHEWADATIALCIEQQLPFMLAGATIWRGSSLTVQGQIEEGISQINQGIDAYHAVGVRWGRPYFLALLAEACKAGKQFEKALAAVSEGLAIAEETGERWYEAELYRLKGELLLARAEKLKIESSGD